MSVIEKKLWPEFFEDYASGKRRFEVRLADFELKEGDVIVFREWDPRTRKYTGRSFKALVTRVEKQNSPTRFWSVEELEKHGIYVFSLEVIEKTEERSKASKQRI